MRISSSLFTLTLAAQCLISAGLPVSAQTAAAPTSAFTSMAPVVAEVTPGVVGISVGQSKESDNPLLSDPAFRRFFEDAKKEGKQAGASTQPIEVRPAGSGVVVDANKGLVLTNHHVINGASRMVVVLQDRRQLVAELVGSDPGTDLAVLRIKPERLKAVPLGDSDAMRIGDFVLAIGNPFGLGQTVTSGIVSAVGRGISPEGYEDYIQTDAAINPGNSGGALVNLRGELIGINTAILSGGRSSSGGGGGGNIGIGFAVPTSMAREVLTQIVAHGEVKRGRIGVETDEVTEFVATGNGLPDIAGAVIKTVARGSSADKAGLRSNDIVRQIDGRTVRTVSDLRNRLALIPVGNSAQMQVWRDRRQLSLQVLVEPITAEQVAATQQAPTPPLAGSKPAEGAASALLGMQLGVGRDGLVVSGVQPNGAAHAAGFRNGDVILGVNREPVDSVQEFNGLIGRAGAKVISVLRGESKLRLNVG